MKEGSQLFCDTCKSYHYVKDCFKIREGNAIRQFILSDFYHCPNKKTNHPAILIVPVR